MSRPSAQVRGVRPHEMFFSLTDDHGVITGANSVFSRIARYSRAELVGSPHSIVRAPEMPAGVFRLMWDVIQDGVPFAGYVLNKANDGARYWVYATVTPVPGGYLSVRTSPSVQEIWVAAASLYEDVLHRELEARAAGMSRADAAILGKQLILEGLAKLGFQTYEDFMRAALPAEASTRAERAKETATPIEAGGDTGIEQIRAIARSIDEEASALLAELDRYKALGDDLHRASLDASERARGLQRASVAARTASEVVAAQAPAVLSTAVAMERDGTQTLRYLGSLAAQLDADRHLIAGLQVRIAVSKLHSDWVITFCEGLLSGDTEEQDKVFIPDVCATLRSTVEMLARSLAQHTRNMTEVVALVESLQTVLGEFQSFLFMWRNLLIRHGVSASVSGHLRPIDSQLSAGFAQMVTLRHLAQRCMRESHPYDSGPLMARVQQLTIAGQAAARVDG